MLIFDWLFAACRFVAWVCCLVGCGWILLFAVVLLGVWCTCDSYVVLVLGFSCCVRRWCLFDCVYGGGLCLRLVGGVCFWLLFGLCLVYLLFGAC